MTPKREHPEVKALADRYNRAKTRYEELRDDLKAAIVKELRAGARPADLHRASGWDREYLRRIKAAADKADAEAEAKAARSATARQADNHPAPQRAASASAPTVDETAPHPVAPWPVPLPEPGEEPPPTLILPKWVLSLAPDEARRLLGRARHEPSYDELWHMFAQMHGAQWAGLATLYGIGPSEETWRSKEPPTDTAI